MNGEQKRGILLTPDDANFIVAGIRSEMARTGNSLLRVVAEGLIRKNTDRRSQTQLDADKVSKAKIVAGIVEEDGYNLLLESIIHAEELISHRPTPHDLIYERLSEMLEDDPSGFVLMDYLTETAKEAAAKENDSSLQKLYEQMQRATKDYKQKYLLAAQAGLGPMPKETA